METVNIVIVAIFILYFVLVCIIYIMLRQISVTIDGLAWITQKLFDDLSKHVRDGEHTSGEKSFDELLDDL